jgi:hypothetical protein
MAKIDESLETQLAQNREIYEDLLGDDNVQFMVDTEHISPEEAREKIKKDRAESEREIRLQFQLERDGELARLLQAQFESSDDESDFDRRPALSRLGHLSPSSTFSPGRTLPQPMYNLPDRTHLNGFSNGSSNLLNCNERNAFDFSSNPPIPMSSRGAGLPMPKNDFDDDLQEITPAYFHSRFGEPRFGPPPMPGTSLLARPLAMPGRTLPWMPEPDPRVRDIYMRDPYMRDPNAIGKAMELVRDQAYLDMDDEDFVYFSLNQNTLWPYTNVDSSSAYEEADFPQDIKNLIAGIKDIRDATKADKDDTPRGLKVTLMKHQKIGLAWMKAKEESSHKGGILADDMGLGKTIQAIALMVARPPTDAERHPVLIICPKALMDQWRLEIQRHVQPGNDQLSVFIFHDKQRNAPWRVLRNQDVIITTFGTLTANFKLLHQAEKLEREGRDASVVKRIQEQAVLYLPTSKFHRVIVDEAQNIKNPLAKSTKACSRINATYRWCLTGTPMMNRLEDFQSLLGYLRIRPYNIKEKFKNVSCLYIFQRSSMLTYWTRLSFDRLNREEAAVNRRWPSFASSSSPSVFVAQRNPRLTANRFSNYRLRLSNRCMSCSVNMSKRCTRLSMPTRSTKSPDTLMPVPLVGTTAMSWSFFCVCDKRAATLISCRDTTPNPLRLSQVWTWSPTQSCWPMPW